MVKKAVLTAVLIVFFLSCGIPEFHFLPQVPEGGIRSEFFTGATVHLPPNHLTDYWYAVGYQIFYRIYLSNEFPPSIETDADRVRINPHLDADFRHFYPFTTTTTTTNVTTVFTLTNFSARQFFQLELEREDGSVFSIPRSGGWLRFHFPDRAGDIPRAHLCNAVNCNLWHIDGECADGRDDYIFNLRRNSDFGVFGGNNPAPEREEIFIDGRPRGHKGPYFQHTPEELGNHAYAFPIAAADRRNPDVAARANLTAPAQYSFVAMYIVAYGVGANFTTTISSPTFINTFRLPNAD